MSPTPKPGEVWRDKEGFILIEHGGCWRFGIFGKDERPINADGWTRVLMADGSVPPEVRRALRSEGYVLGKFGPEMTPPAMQWAETACDARWPEDAPK